MKSINPKSIGAVAKIFTLALSLGMAGQLSAQSPYANGSAADNILNFSSGVGGSATADLPAFTILVGTNDVRDSGTGGGWSIGAAGSANVGLEVGLPPLASVIVPLASTQAQTTIGGNSLSFQTVSDGILGGLASPGLFMEWDASTSIATSTGWAAGTYAYQFDLNLAASVLNLNPNVLGSFNLVISDNSGALFTGSVFGDVLGITSLSSTSYSDVSAEFVYDPTNGPLNISFTATAPVDATLLNIFDDSTTTTLYNVSGADIVIVPVPEPSGALLLGVSGVLLIVRRRRRA